MFDDTGNEVGRSQLEHRQILPRPGWVEHDPIEIAVRVDEVMTGALRGAGLSGRDLAAIGITNQRETTIVWNPKTGQPWHNAIVWQDTRTERQVVSLEPKRAWLCARTGLPPATYFSATKLRWILDSVDGVRDAVRQGAAIFGTVDSWIIWNLTGGTNGGLHVTDVTNASRTQLLNLRTLDWDDELLDLFGIPRSMLPASAIRRTGRRTARRGPTARWGRTCRSRPLLAISTRQQSGRSASRLARRRTPTAPVTSCCSTRDRRSSRRTQGC